MFAFFHFVLKPYLVPYQGAADPHGRPCQWNSGRCFSIESGRCSRTLAVVVEVVSGCCETWWEGDPVSFTLRLTSWRVVLCWLRLSSPLFHFNVHFIIFHVFWSMRRMMQMQDVPKILCASYRLPLRRNLVLPSLGWNQRLQWSI